MSRLLNRITNDSTFLSRQRTAGDCQSHRYFNGLTAFSEAQRCLSTNVPVKEFIHTYISTHHSGSPVFSFITSLKSPITLSLQICVDGSSLSIVAATRLLTGQSSIAYFLGSASSLEDK